MAKKLTYPPISIVIPVFNEAGSVRSVLERLHQYLTREHIANEIIVVNDGSTDDSLKILKDVPFVKVIEHKLNRGYSASLKDGIKSAMYDWILTYDADGQHEPQSISLLLPYVNDYDLIVGARKSDSHDTVTRGLGRKIVSKLAEYISEARIEDINSGFRLFKKELALKFWHLYPERFSFSTTITVAAHSRRFPVMYVPIMVLARKAGNSTIKPMKDFTGFISLVARLAVYFRPLKVFVPMGLFFYILAIAWLILEYILVGTISKTVFVVLISTGTQIFFFGLLAEMIVKRFYQD